MPSARVSIKLVAVSALVAAVSGCVVQGDNRDFQPAPLSSSGGASGAADPMNATAPITVATIDPLNAPPPAATPEGMLVPPPGTEANSSQRVPLGALSTAPAAPAAPMSILQPAGTPVVPAQPAAQSAPQPAPVMMAQAAPPAPMMAPAAPMTPAAEMPAKDVIPAQKPAAPPTVRLHMPDASPPTVMPPTPAPTVNSSEDTATVVISSSTPKGVTPREFVPASLAPPPTISNPGPGDIPLTAAEKNTIQRFAVLRRLETEDLITHEEYTRRRNANAGGLLPYTHTPPAVGLGRPVPSGDAIVARLAALRRSFEMRAITPQQHALERTMILNALLPETPDDRDDPLPPPHDMIEGAALAGHLERLREQNLITAEEMTAEKDAIEHAVLTGLLPSQDTKTAKRNAGGPAGAKGPGTPGAATATAKVEETPMTREITGPVLHIASYRSEAAALKGWDEVISKDKAIIGAMKPIVRKVDLGDKGVFYRLMAGSYPSLSDAEAACVKLKEANQFCRASVDGN